MPSRRRSRRTSSLFWPTTSAMPTCPVTDAATSTRPILTASQLEECASFRATPILPSAPPRALDAVNCSAKSGQPCLISLQRSAPHWAWEAPGDEAESKRVAGTSLRDFDGGTQKTYQRMIEAMDAQIGRVLDALDANGLT